MEILRYFEENPNAKLLYDAVKNKILDSMENVDIKIHKTQISFSTNKNFASVWVPIRKMKNRPEMYIILTIGLDRQIKSPRIVEAVEPYPNRWTHHIIIQSPSDMDDEILDWLHQAYRFSQRK